MMQPSLPRRRLFCMTLCGCVCSAMLGAIVIQASHRQATPASSSTGTITGRIITDEGRPVPHAPVFAFSTGFMPQTTNTDEQGRFQFTGLPAGSYLFNTSVPGYVSSSMIELAANDGIKRVYYRLGDAVTLTVIKGGVLTGRVTDASGEAITGLGVRALPVRDAEGNPFFSSSRLPLSKEGQTDDRGVYRIYGLAPGSYLVRTTDRASHSSGLPPRVGQAPTYYPASTGDTAEEVTVHRGEEVSGIDIRFRGERCYAVSGAVVKTAAASAAPPDMQVQIFLYNLATRATEAGTTIRPSNGKYAFAFYDVPDGEYEIAANGMMSDEVEIAALPRRVLVKRADVTGIELTLTPLSSISGRIVMESGEARLGCEIKRPSRLEEITLTTRLAERTRRDEAVSSWYRVTANAVPDGKGEFTLHNLTPARYRLETSLPGEHWYIKSITAPNPAAVRQTLDAGRNGLALKAGEKTTGLTITIAEGAASLRGQIKPEGVRLPASLRVYLVPAEREQADNVLRYAEAATRKDGQFAFTNLAPGRYWIIARLAESDPTEAPPPTAWDQAERAKLRREAEAAKVEIELQPCQRVNDYTLRYAPPTSK